MQIFAVMMVRDEADILRVNVLHHLALGIDQFLIVDHDSSDGTDQVLRELSESGRVQWTLHSGPYRQSEITTELAHEAYLRGADWVVAIDADEFWHAPGRDFRAILEKSAAVALEVEIITFIQRRDQTARSPRALLHMTRRTPKPVGPLERARELVGTRKYAYVEIVSNSHWIVRASLAVEIAVGNSWVTGVQGGLEKTNRIVCLHAPLSARDVLQARVGSWERALGGIRRLDQYAWHWLRWSRLAEEGEMDKEWSANSYADDCLDVCGQQHPVVFDPRLRDVVAPWIDYPSLRKTEVGAAESFVPLNLRLQLRQRETELVSSTLKEMKLIDGWLTEDEARFLMATTSLALLRGEPSAVVEVGSYCGRSTLVLAAVVKEVCPSIKVFAIDPHEGELTAPDQGLREAPPSLEVFRKNIETAGLTNVVKPILKHSSEVLWDEPISLLFIDGLHDYENVSRDFHHFGPWVVSGGYVAFHDYGETYPGVEVFVDELLASGDYRKLQCVDILIVLEKLRPNESPADEAESDRVGATLRSSPIPERDLPMDSNVHLPAAETQTSGCSTNATTDGESRMTEAKQQSLAMRVERQEKGIAILQEVLRNEMARREEMVGERDDKLEKLLAQYHEEVGKRDGIIGEVLEEKRLQIEKRDRIISDLNTQLQTEVAKRDRMINDRHAKLQTNAPEREVVSSERHAELQSKLAEPDNAIAKLEAPLEGTLAEGSQARAHLNDKRDAELNERDKTIHELQSQLEEIHHSKTWHILRFYLALRQKLRFVRK